MLHISIIIENNILVNLKKENFIYFTKEIWSSHKNLKTTNGLNKLQGNKLIFKIRN